MNPFNARNCGAPGCDTVLSTTSQAEEIWMDETAKEVAFSIARSGAGVEKEKIEQKAEELVDEKFAEGEVPI